MNRQLHLLLQTVLVLVITMIMLLLFGRATMQQISGVVGASSLASSVFILFMLPHSAAAKPRRFVGSYVIALLLGLAAAYITKNIAPQADLSWYIYTHQIMAALGVVAVMVAMIFLDMQHPPAAGFVLGLILDDWNHFILLTVIGIVLLLAVLHCALRHRLLSL